MSNTDYISKHIKNSFENTHLKAPKSIWANISQELDAQQIDQSVKSSFEAEKYTAPIFNFEQLKPHQIDEKVKASFEAEKASAPVFNFDKIKNFETDLDHKIHDSFEAERNVLPDSIWQNIQNQNDVATTWGNIAPHIEVNTFRWRKLAVAGVIIAFISLLPPTQLKDTLNSGFISGFAFKSTPTQSTQITTQAKNNALASITSTVVSSVQPSSANIQSKTTILANHTMHESQPINVVEDNNGIAFIHAPTKLISLASHTETLVSSPTEFETEQPKKLLNHFNLGLYGSINNTWVMDEDTRNGFEENSLHDPQMAFGESRGIVAEYMFSDKFSLSGTFLAQSRVKNKIGFYDNGYYKLKTTEINYTKAFISARFKKAFQPKISRITGDIVYKKIVCGIGPYLAHIKNSLIYTDDVITSFNSDYKEWDFGVNVNIGKEHQWNCLILEYGLNSNVGLNNIINDKTTFASNLNIGLYTTLRDQ